MRRLLLSLAALLAAPALAQRPFDPADNARVFDAAYEEVDSRYWDKARLDRAWQDAHDRYRAQALAAQTEAQRYAAIQAMLNTLHDSHVYAVAPALVAMEAARETGEAASSFGMSFWRDDGDWRVLTVRAGSPAALAGVQIGWQLVAIDGKPVDNDFHSSLDHDSVLRFVDEDRSSHQVTLRGALLDPDPERRARRLADGTLVLALDVFQPGAERWISDRLNDGPPPPAVVLDFRENEGGDADAIARVAGRFFLEKRTLLRRTKRDGFENVPIAGAGRRAFAGPLAVLVGPRSASGAEAIAAMVEESGRGITVGERTSGALTGASEMELPDGGRLSVAVFDIRTPEGRRIEGSGFTPRYVVKPTLADLRAGRDPALERAVRLLAR